MDRLLVQDTTFPDIREIQYQAPVGPSDNCAPGVTSHPGYLTRRDGSAAEWIEHSAPPCGGNAFPFSQVAVSAALLSLADASRGTVTLDIDVATCGIFYADKNNPRYKLYTIEKLVAMDGTVIPCR